MLQTITRVVQIVSRLGLSNALKFLFVRHRQRRSGGSFELAAKCLAYPIRCRAGTSDLAVFRSLVLGGEYDCLREIEDLSFVVDCGANIGISAAWFLSRYPACEVVSIEPDPDNFQLLKKNLQPYGRRWHGHEAAIWGSSRDVLELHRGYRDGREWARAVRVASSDVPRPVVTLTLPQVLARLSEQRVSLLKIDVEGAEISIFREGVHEWIGQVDRILIELHDPECEVVFHKAVPDEVWSKRKSGDLLLCQRRAGLA